MGDKRRSKIRCATHSVIFTQLNMVFKFVTPDPAHRLSFLRRNQIITRKKSEKYSQRRSSVEKGCIQQQSLARIREHGRRCTVHETKGIPLKNQWLIDCV